MTEREKDRKPTVNPGGKADLPQEKEEKNKRHCPIRHACGGCAYQCLPYKKQLMLKQKAMSDLLSFAGKTEQIIGMENPLHYRAKVHHVFARGKAGNVVSGFYKAGSHHVRAASECMLEDTDAQSVICDIERLATAFEYSVYDEDRGTGFLRHVLVRKSFADGNMMVVLVTGNAQFPGKQAFLKELNLLHPNVSTVVQNINNKKTSMVLGEKSLVLRGPGYIYENLCGLKFRLSDKSFFQVNPIQTQKLYDLALECAGLSGTERVIDAYCGTGTIGLAAAGMAKSVVGVELSASAVGDARANAAANGIKNARFVCADAGEFMVKMARQGEKADLVFMDPPRSGATRAFLSALLKLGPEKIVYISCGPQTLARDLRVLLDGGYRAERICPVDMFPFTEHVECVVLLSQL